MRNINILILLLISSSAFCEEVTEEIKVKEVKKESETEVVPKRHHEDDKINEKMEQYIKLLEKKRNAIDKFLTENYSDFNHSDYTPEVQEFIKLKLFFILISYYIAGVCKSSH